MRFDISMLAAGLAIGLGLALLLPSTGHAADPSPAYRDARLPIEARIDDLLARMTLEEKVAQLQGLWLKKYRVQDARGEFDAETAARNFPHGLGQLSRPGDRVGLLGPDAPPQAAGAVARAVNRNASEAARYTNSAQRWAVEKTRLGIPLLFHEEALHGFVWRDATSFPQAIALASTWDPVLVERVYTVAAREMRARGAQLALAPVLDIARDPRWGRSEETFGEDPHLAGEIGLAAIRGLQGETLPLGRDKVFVTLKHLAGHGQPESGMNVGPAHIGERTLRESVLRPFERAVRSLPIRSVMASYNEIDGVPSHVNRWLLHDVLREEWGFQGVVVSDYFALREIQTVHAMSEDPDQIALRALEAGVDVELPDVDLFAQLPALVRSGRVSEARIDASVRRVLRMKFEAGIFERPYVNVVAAEKATATASARALAQEAAARALVLLKNKDDTLPLDPMRKGRLLVVGTHARDTPIGGYSDVPKQVVSVLDGVRASAGRSWTVDYAEGVRLTRSRVWEEDAVVPVPASENAPLIAEALARAREADVVLLVLGENEQLSREAWAKTHLGDRSDLSLFGEQLPLARALFALDMPVVVLLLNGRPLALEEIAAGADALLEGWYLGQETGHGVADVVFGKVSPGGKLPVTLPRSAGQLPLYYSHKPSARRGYLFDDAKPLFPFGFGLTYSRFTLDAPTLSHAVLPNGTALTVSAQVRNTGTRRADQVLQLYLRDRAASVTRPVRELRRFQRLTLGPGEAQTVRFELGADDFSLLDATMRRIVEPGKFEVMLGFDSVETVSAEVEVQ